MYPARVYLFTACRSTVEDCQHRFFTFSHERSETYVLIARNLLLETLALTGLSNDLTRLGGRVKRRSTRQDGPVVEDGLREGLATGGGTEISSESEGLVDRQVSLDGVQRSSGSLFLGVDVSTAAGEDTVDATHGALGHLDLDVVDGLEDGRLGKEGGGVEHTTSSWDDLTTTTVDGIGVQGNIQDVETDRAHGLLRDRTFAGGPLETRDEGVLDFLEVLDSLSLVDQQVGTAAVRTEAPDLTGIGDIPAVLVGQDTGTSLEIVTWVDLAALDGLANLLIQLVGSNVQTVVLVGRLGQGGHARVAGYSLTVRDDGVGDTERNTSVVLLEILQANLKVQLTSTGDDVLTGLGDVGQNARVRLGQTLETLDQLGQVVGVLDLDGTLHDRRDRELHDLQVVGGLGGGDGTRLQKELVDTNQTDDVTSRDILDGLDETTHHENSTLDSLDEQVLLLARGVVRTLDADLETRLDGTREHTAEGVETTLVRGRHHLGNVQHERSLGVTVTDTNADVIVWRTLVQSLGTVLLGSDGGRQVEDDHLQKGISSRQEFAHDNLKERLALKILLLAGELDVKLLNEGSNLLLLGVGDRVEDLDDGVEDKLVEGTLELLALILGVLGPLLGLGVEVVVTLISFLVSTF